MRRIGEKIEGLQYTKRLGAYAIIEREEDNKVGIATANGDYFFLAQFDKKVSIPIEKDHKILWVKPEEYKDKLYHEYQRYIVDEYKKLKEEKKGR